MDFDLTGLKSYATIKRGKLVAFDFTQWARDNGVAAYKPQIGGLVSIELEDGRFGVAPSIDEALTVAKTGETNIRRVPA